MFCARPQTHPRSPERGASGLCGALVLYLLLAACGSPSNERSGSLAWSAPEAAWRAQPTAFEDPPSYKLPADWASCEPLAFERLIERDFPVGCRWRLSDKLREGLAKSLALQDQAAVRAAVLLGRSRTLEGARSLLARLELRAPAPETWQDAGDTLCAMFCAALPLAPDTAARLEALSIGPNPHPDLEVRVECARGALQLGRDAVIPFLLQVLRIDTPAGLADQRDFVPNEQTAWARSRAAEVLSWRAGVPTRYGADSSMAEREAATAALAQLLPK